MIIELSNKELTTTNGGGCSFAYDAGYFFRQLGPLLAGTYGVAQYSANAAVYDNVCND